jgi:hypothetical protein
VLLTSTSTAPNLSSAASTRRPAAAAELTSPETSASRSVELAPRVLEDLLAPAGEHDGRALLEEARRRRSPDSAAAAGDDRNRALELWHLDRPFGLIPK